MTKYSFLNSVKKYKAFVDLFLKQSLIQLGDKCFFTFLQSNNGCSHSKEVKINKVCPRYLQNSSRIHIMVTVHLYISMARVFWSYILASSYGNNKSEVNSKCLELPSVQFRQLCRPCLIRLKLFTTFQILTILNKQQIQRPIPCRDKVNIALNRSKAN